MDSAAERIAIARAEYEGLRAFLSGLAPRDWARPSACQGWEVRDVVAHLVSTTDFQAEMVRRGLEGEYGPPEHYEGTDVHSRRARIAQHAIAAREQLGPDPRSTFSEHYQRLFDLLTSLSPGDLETPCYHPIGADSLVKARTYIDLVVLETSLHGWDIRWALDPSAALGPESLPVLMEYASRWLDRILCPRSPEKTPLRYRFHVRGWDTQAKNILVEGNGFSEVPPDASPPTATLRCDADTYLLLHFGRLTFADAMDKGRLRVEGDAQAVARLDDWAQYV